MKSAITHLWSSLRDLATQSPILLALIAVFSCTPLLLNKIGLPKSTLGSTGCISLSLYYKAI